MTNPESKYEDDICFICSYGWQRIENCRECLFNVLKEKWTTENKNNS